MNGNEKRGMYQRGVLKKHSVSSPHAIKIKHGSRCFHYSARGIEWAVPSATRLLHNAPHCLVTKQTSVTSKRKSHYSETEMYQTGSKIKGKTSPERYSLEKTTTTTNRDLWWSRTSSDWPKELVELWEISKLILDQHGKQQFHKTKIRIIIEKKKLNNYSEKDLCVLQYLVLTFMTSRGMRSTKVQKKKHSRCYQMFVYN